MIAQLASDVGVLVKSDLAGLSVEEKVRFFKAFIRECGGAEGYSFRRNVSPRMEPMPIRPRDAGRMEIGFGQYVGHTIEQAWDEGGEDYLVWLENESQYFLLHLQAFLRAKAMSE